MSMIRKLQAAGWDVKEAFKSAVTETPGGLKRDVLLITAPVVGLLMGRPSAHIKAVWDERCSWEKARKDKMDATFRANPYLDMK